MPRRRGAEFAYLEDDLQSKVDAPAATVELVRVQEVRIVNPRIASGIDGGVVDTSDRKHAWIGEAELAMIEDVEELRPELYEPGLIKMEALEQTHVKVRPPRRRDCVATHGTHGTCLGAHIFGARIDGNVSDDLSRSTATKRPSNAVPTYGSHIRTLAFRTVEVQDRAVAGRILVTVGVRVG